MLCEVASAGQPLPDGVPHCEHDPAGDIVFAQVSVKHGDLSSTLDLTELMPHHGSSVQHHTETQVLVMLQYLVNELLPCPGIHIMFDARRVIPLVALDICLHLQAQRHQEFTFLNATGIPYVQLLERLPSCITCLGINLPDAHLCSNDIQILLWGALERKWGVPGPDRHTGVLATCRRALEPEQLCR